MESEKNCTGENKECYSILQAELPCTTHSVVLLSSKQVVLLPSGMCFPCIYDTYLLTSFLPTYLLLNASIGKKKDLATNQAKIRGFSELHLGFLTLFSVVLISHAWLLFLLYSWNKVPTLFLVCNDSVLLELLKGLALPTWIESTQAKILFYFYACLWFTCPKEFQLMLE